MNIHSKNVGSLSKKKEKNSEIIINTIFFRVDHFVCVYNQNEIEVLWNLFSPL